MYVLSVYNVFAGKGVLLHLVASTAGKLIFVWPPAVEDIIRDHKQEHEHFKNDRDNNNTHNIQRTSRLFDLECQEN